MTERGDVIEYERERVLAIQNRLNSPTDYIQYQIHSAKALFDWMSRFLDPAGHRVLEVGCGTGGISLHLASRGMIVAAVDKQQYDSAALAAAREYAKAHSLQVDIELADAVALPFRDRTFDCVVCSSVVEHLEDPRGAMCEMGRVLKPGGLAFVDFPLFRGPYGGHIDDVIKAPWFHTLPGSMVRKVLMSRDAEREYRVYQTLNRLTHRKFRTIIQHSGFVVVTFRRMYYLTHPGRKLLLSLYEALRHRSVSMTMDSLREIPRDFSLQAALQFVFLASLVPLSLA